MLLSIEMKIDWLNKFLQLMWPYLDKVLFCFVLRISIFLPCRSTLIALNVNVLFIHSQAICKTAKNIVTPIIAEHIPKYKIESMEFEVLTLGSLPPTFQG